jgi:hypothetical protein
MCPRVPPVANDHDRPMTLHTNRTGLGSNRMRCSVELLPSMYRIYGDSEHLMTEIDLEAEEIYARVVVQVGGLFRCLRLSWINYISTRIIKLTSHCPGPVLYCMTGLGVRDNEAVFFPTLPSLTQPITSLKVYNNTKLHSSVSRSPFPSNCPRYVDQRRYLTNVVNEPMNRANQTLAFRRTSSLRAPCFVEISAQLLAK